MKKINEIIKSLIDNSFKVLVKGDIIECSKKNGTFSKTIIFNKTKSVNVILKNARDNSPFEFTLDISNFKTSNVI